MFNFREIGQLASLMKQLPKLKGQMEEFQQKVAQIICEGDAGGGMVKVKINGKMEVLSCKIAEDFFKQGDREMLEDLVAAATNQALQRVREQVSEETSKMAGDLGFALPPGMSLPGLT